MGNFMCGQNEASGGLSFFEGLTYNYIKKPNQQPLGFKATKVCKYTSTNYHISNFY